MSKEDEVLTLTGDLLEMDTEDTENLEDDELGIDTEMEDDELGGEIDDIGISGEEVLSEKLAITVEPDTGGRDDVFKATVYNAKSTHKVKIRTDIPWATDPVIATRTGDGSVMFYGRDLLKKTGAKDYEDTEVRVYAQEVRPWAIDRESARTPVVIKAVPGTTPPPSEGLPYITISPTSGHREDEFTITIKGAPTKEEFRQVNIYAVKEGWGRDNDPLIATHDGNGTVKVFGSQLLKGINAPPTVDKLLSIYPALVYPVFDPGPSIRVMIEAEPVVVKPPETGEPGEPGVPEAPVCTEGDVVGSFVCHDGKWVHEAEEVPGETPYTPPETTTPGVTPIYLTPEQAAARLAKGLPCYIKCTLPILSMLPGIPYMAGIPLLPGFVITMQP